MTNPRRLHYAYNMPQARHAILRITEEGMQKITEERMQRRATSMMQNPMKNN